MKTRDFDWNQEDVEYKLGQEIEYIQGEYKPEKIIIEKGKSIKIYNPKGRVIK